MAQCRKCGNKKCTRRRAKQHFCQRCGMQPSDPNVDRSGLIACKSDYYAMRRKVVLVKLLEDLGVMR